MGRPVQVVERNHLGGISRTSSKYDFRGYLLSFHESHQTSGISTADVQLTIYSYDSRGRLLSETTTVNSQSGGTVSYTYDNLGKLISKSYGNGVTESITYNIQGWLTSKSAVKSGSNIFNIMLRYYDPVYATAIYSGNIPEVQWQHGAGSNNAYAFVYDTLSRLTTSTRYSNGTPKTSFTERDITYDRNGNITSLKRYGSNWSTPDDNFTYNYDGNRITSITGSVSAVYTYDSNGNMAGDGRKKLQMQYNLINLPQTVNQGSVSKARYIWLSDGTKVAVVEDTISNNGYTYLGSMVYSRSGSNHTLESVSFGQGRIVHSTGTYTPYYHTTDHLGSVRVITSPTGTISEQNDYYPFGERTNLGQQYQQLSTNRYKYNGKEEQTTGSLGYLDYGARFYDPAIARWNTVDPLAEKNIAITPFAFVANNPIRFIDPDGKDIWEINDEGRIINRIKDKTQDAFYMVAKDTEGNYQRAFTTDAEGNKNYNSISFEYGTISDSKKLGWFRSATSFAVNSESSGAELFKFFADNTKIEYGLINTQSNGSTVMTNHNESSVSVSATAKSLSDKGQTVTSVVHNHPNSSNPSGFRKGDTSGDKFAANLLTYSHGYQVERYVYQPRIGNLVAYDEKSVIGYMPWKLIFTPSKARKTPIFPIRQYPGVGLPPL